MKKQKNNKKRRIKTLSITLIFYLLSLAFIKEEGSELLTTYKENKKAYALSEEAKNAYLEELTIAVRENPTISKDIKESLLCDIESLVASNMILLPKHERKLVYHLRNDNFENQKNDIEILCQILFKNNDIFSKCVVSSLSEWAGNESSCELSTLFGELTYPISDEIAELLFIDGEDGIKERLAEEYHVPIDKIEEIFAYLSYYDETENEEDKKRIKGVIESEYAPLLLNYYKEKESLDEIDQLIFASTIFDGDIQFKNNIFHHQFLFTIPDKKYGEYTRYFSKYTRLDESMAIYQQRLIDLIEEKGKKLNYGDSDSRLLISLYYLCNRANSSSKEVRSITDSVELSERMIKELFNNERYNELEKEFLYAYFSNGTLNTYDLTDNQTYLSNPYTLGLYFEYLQCLKEECQNGNLTEERLNRFVAKTSTSDSLDELYKESLENEQTLFEEFSIMPNEYEPTEEAKAYFLKENN